MTRMWLIRDSAHGEEGPLISKRRIVAFDGPPGYRLSGGCTT